MKAAKTPIRVSILGAGVTGLTTGIVLQLHGHQTKIFTDRLLHEIESIKLADRPPTLAGLHAAASVIPHSVKVGNERRMTATSLRFFQRLAFSSRAGVRVQRHYELAEFPPPPPEYARAVAGFEPLDPNGNEWLRDPAIPRRKRAKAVYGWKFNAFFCEAPAYLRYLVDLYLLAGGEIERQAIHDRDELPGLVGEPDVIVNCMGLGALKLFPEDSKNTILYRGHMVKVHVYEVPFAESDNQYFSYNYFPGKDVYERFSIESPVSDDSDDRTTEPADVYFYPRSDGWLLGGSRERGHLDDAGEWIGDEPAVKCIRRPRWEVEVPEPIWELNRELIEDVTGIDISNAQSFSYIGYRFHRDPVRVEPDSGEPLILHNYGHGGAGYTLSWGCACEIAAMTESHCDAKPAFLERHGLSLAGKEGMLAILEDLARDLYLERAADVLTGATPQLPGSEETSTR